jgi:hypothetical protein
MALFSSKSAPPWIAMTLFRPRDRVIKPDAEGGEDVEYAIPAKLAKARLHVMGFTLDRARADYERCRNEEIERLVAYRVADPGESWADEELKTVRLIGFDAFVAACRKIFESGLSAYELHERGESDPVIVRIASKYMEPDPEWSFYCRDARSLVRVLLEVVPDETSVSVDMTGLIASGYWELSDDMVEIALANRRGTYAIDSPIIVLPEGVTDTEVIGRSMAVLHPGLRDYYRFLDHSARPSGGAAQLTNAVRAFVAAGIENRIIAVFDNDAEGHAQLQILRGQRLPSNVRAMTYPDIDLARSYPTLGPTGPALHNINGTAASVELYFGDDILRTRAGDLAPIHWKGRNEAIGRYQGEIEHKNTLKERFLEKLTRVESGAPIVEHEWQQMRSLLDAILGAFHA